MLSEVASGPDARAVVITGAGDVFCAGADLKGAPGPMTPAAAHDVVKLYLDYIVAVRSVEKPMVAMAMRKTRRQYSRH